MFNQTAQSEEMLEMSLSNSDIIPFKKNSQIVDQLQEKKKLDCLTDTFRKPFEKQKKIGTRDKMLEKNRKTREEQLAELKEIKQDELYKDPIQIFFKSMASTVATFSPELAVEAKSRVFNIISEMELRALKVNTSNTSSVKPIVPGSHLPSKITPTVFIEGDSSSSATPISSISESNVSSPTTAAYSNYTNLQYCNNDY